MKKIILVFNAILFFLSFESVNAKRYVKIATIGAISPPLPREAGTY